ncbi:hypothetical protein [Alkalimarinus alittae]|uniref:TIGR04197 family type VII secretion effector n=1 Tax=Alkalimarinus alittae TaxID=2961619 RepID=A0ABY6N3W9_9ALTE|nr:hypothetical protein [Alkalimarinus alittae]UZE96783.1 hypothetical protein NKI27_03255 [Alkalimarinus alittae]
MTTLLQRLELAKDVAQTAIDNTVTAVESVHTVIADTSYSILNQGAVDEKRLNSLKEKHDLSASKVYDAIRDVNQNIGQLASDYFATLEDSAHASEVMTKNNQKDNNPS